ncbi:MAG TPA: HTH domain-containing protein [Erysipelothrix sp.]|nr:HTH domain-containing protein [Erysipelothrix sp.]
MLAKTQQFNELLDLYGELLTARQTEVMELYYHEDLSYQEIADELSISKAAVYDIIKRVSKTLVTTEEKVGFHRYQQQVQKLIIAIEDGEDIKIKQAIKQIQKEI